MRYYHDLPGGEFIRTQKDTNTIIAPTAATPAQKSSHHSLRRLNRTASLNTVTIIARIWNMATNTRYHGLDIDGTHSKKWVLT